MKLRSSSCRTGLLLLTAALSLSACSGGKSGDDAAPKPVALVALTTAVRTDLAETTALYGAAEFAPSGEHSLIAPVEAILSRIEASPGQTVSAGQVVAVLTPSPAAHLDLSRAEHDAETAQAAYARAQRLRQSGLDSDADVEAAKAAAATASETLASLKSRSGAGLLVRAPMAGVVEAFAAAPGDQVAAGASFGKIGDTAALRIRLGAEAQGLRQLKIGDRVDLTPLAGGPSASGRISAIDPRLDPQTRLAVVFVTAPAGFAPGQPVRGDVALRIHSGAITAPRSALVFEDDKPGLFVVEKGVAHHRDVGVGVSAGEAVEIVSGLKAGEQLVTTGAANLEDGMAVRQGPLKPDNDKDDKKDDKGGA